MNQKNSGKYKEDNMGFFDDLLGATESSLGGSIREKYRQMSRGELEREWERKFSNKPYTDAKNWREGSVMAILDEEYSERFCRKSWYDKAKSELRAAELREKERQRIEQEQIEREEQEKRQRMLRREQEEQFKTALDKSEMVAKLITVIDENQYSATDILIGNDEMQVFNENEEIENVKYKRYGYPNLEDYQINILTDYLRDKLELKFEKVSYDRLELNDAPGGMRTSW